MNGKVERAQKTVPEELYAVNDLGRADLADELGYYQHYYNWMRQHSSLGKTSLERYVELSPITPLSEHVFPLIDLAKERIYHRQRAGQNHSPR